ncbi:MAG: lysylphosphatidylglycerol synthase domain-containing protein [Limnohabitans sp.]|jgi:hypothetical protein
MKYQLNESHYEPHVRMRKWLFRLAFWALAVVLLVALVRKSDWSLTWTRLLNIPLDVIFFCIWGWLCSFAFRALRFQSEWKAYGHIGMMEALNLTFLHNAAVVVVPFRVGELGYPVLIRKLLNVSWQQCLRSLLWLRFQDGVVLLAIAFLLLPFLQLESRLACVLIFILVVLFSKKWWLNLLRSRHFLIRHVRTFLHQRSDAWGWVWSFSNWACKLTVVAVMLQYLTGLTHTQSLRGALTGELSALLPLTGPAGLGTYEAGVWSGLGLTWIEMKNLMSSVLLTHLFFLSISLSGAVLALIWSAIKLKKLNS